jgi:prolyl oligopeptidase
VGFDGKDEVAVHPNEVSSDESVSVQLSGVSEDGSILIYAVRKGGEDEIEIRLLDVKSRRLLAGALPRARYTSFSLKKDNSGFYYGRFDPEGPRIYYHALGTSFSLDPKIFGDGYTKSAWVSARFPDEDGRWLLIEVSHGAAGKTDDFLRDDKAQGPVKPVAVGLDAEFRPFLAGGTIFLWTNWRAPNWRILAVDPVKLERTNWKEIVPEGASPIESVNAAGGRLFAHYLENVLPRVKQFDAGGKFIGEFRAPGPGTIRGPYGR